MIGCGHVLSLEAEHQLLWVLTLALQFFFCVDMRALSDRLMLIPAQAAHDYEMMSPAITE